MADAGTGKFTRRGFLRFGVRAGIVFSAGTFVSLAWARYIEPEWIDIEEVEVRLPRLPKAFDGYRIAHVSDLHIECGSTAEYWPAIADMVTRQGADLICLTGDYISSYNKRWDEPVAVGLKRLKAPDGIFAVLGNHDRVDGGKLARAALQAAGVRELVTETLTLRRGGEQLLLAGIEDAQVESGCLARILEMIPADLCSVLLCHEPDYVDYVAPGRKIDLMLSGHAHGGQVCLPIIGPILLPFMGKKYWKGLNKVLDTFVYTTRGIGMVGIPVRLGARPEITVLTLRRG